MQLIDGRIRLSPTDLANYAACRHLTALDLKAARGEITPEDGFSHVTAALRKRGEAHEAAYIGHLKSQGLTITDLRGQGLDNPTATLNAMKAGVGVIVQAPLVHDGWGGFADVLRRVDTPSDLGGWSYEPLDTKLARETRGSAILQLCAYAAVLEQLQGLPPEHLHVVSPGDPFTEQAFRRADYAAYYRRIRRQLEALVRLTDEPMNRCTDDPMTRWTDEPMDRWTGTYPNPVPHCDICRWWAHCDAHRRRDDHLSLVAGIRALHIDQFQRWGVPTLEALGTLAVPLPGKPDRGSVETLVRAREQARVQLAGRVAGAPVHELLDFVPDTGLHRLPAPSPGDIFFDIEGDPFVPKDGLEYLFGWVTDDGPYEAVWALTPEEEKRAFERFVDVVMARWAAHPGLHIYHYAPYEPSAVKRLMGRYATREDEVDRMLRAELFVDLYAIVRQSVRASVERYSIKALEPFYAFPRQLPLAEAGPHLRTVESILEFGAGNVRLQAGDSGSVRLQANPLGSVRLQPDPSGSVRLQADPSARARVTGARCRQARLPWRSAAAARPASQTENTPASPGQSRSGPRRRPSSRRRIRDSAR
jgi:predicted RecB family nuclease